MNEYIRGMAEARTLVLELMEDTLQAAERNGTAGFDTTQRYVRGLRDAITMIGMTIEQLERFEEEERGGAA